MPTRRDELRRRWLTIETDVHSSSRCSRPTRLSARSHVGAGSVFSSTAPVLCVAGYSPGPFPSPLTYDVYQRGCRLSGRRWEKSGFALMGLSSGQASRACFLSQFFAVAEAGRQGDQLHITLYWWYRQSKKLNS